MAINWDEVRKKAQERGAAAEAQVNLQRVAPSLPKEQPKPIPRATPQTFRNASGLTKITEEQQAKNQELALEELRGKQGNIASLARGAAGGLIDPYGIRKFIAPNTAQDQASAQNSINVQAIKNPRMVSQGLNPVETVNLKPTYEGIGEFGGSMVGVDPLAIGITKGAQAIGRKVLPKAVKQIPINPAMTDLERLAYESNVRKGKITPQNDTLYGNSFRPTMGELPAPKSKTNPTTRTLNNPDVYYHGTNTQFDDFDMNKINSNEPAGDYVGKGIFFTGDPEKARRYGNIVKSAHLDLKNPLVINTKDDINNLYDLFGGMVNYVKIKRANPQLIQDKLKSMGYDGLVDNLYDQYAVFDAKQIRQTELKPGIYAAAKGQREVPRTITPNELPRANKAQPLPQAPTKPVQPVLPKKGTEISKEQPFFENEGLKSVGADTSKGEKTTSELVNEYGALPKGEMPRAREIDVPKKTDYGETQRYARTLQESAIVDDTLYKDINDAITQGSFTKPTKGNRAAVDDANVTLEQGLDEAVTKFKSVLSAEKQPTSYDIALGNRVLQELQKEGRYDEAVNVAIDLSEMLSETGRTLQAARIAKRLSPEGRLMIATRTAQKVGKKTNKKINLSDAVLKDISEATTEKEIVEANQKAAIEIWNQTPANWVDKVNSWRYMAMLFNPKTHIRNVAGNSIFLPVREFKNLLGAGLERTLIRNGERTKAALDPRVLVPEKTASESIKNLPDYKLIEFARNDFKNVKAILKNEGKLDSNVRNLDASVFGKGNVSKALENQTKLKGKAKATLNMYGDLLGQKKFSSLLPESLELTRRLNLGALDAEDTWFMKFAYDSSLAQYMKANKITPDNMVGETLEAGRKYAMNEALKATYRDFNALANIISKGKANLSNGKYGVLGKAGGVALEGLIPFTKTPLNIVKRGVAYSPANLVRGIVNLGRVKSGKVTATEAIDQLASGLSGTALLALGTYLGYNNIVNGKEGDYKDKLYNYNQMLGSQNYSLNIGGSSYTIDWAAPLSMPFFVGVEIANAVKDNNADLATVIDSMTQISDPMVNLSMLKGINDIMTNNFEGLGQTAFDVGTGYAGQFNPTLFGQIARTADTTRRSTISTAETGTERGLEKFGRKQLAKLPLASKTLEPYVDLWGREQKSGNFAENFLSPGYFKSANVTEVDKQLKSLVDRLDEETVKKILPTSTAYQYTIESSGVPYRMTEKESTAYQKTRGQESYKGLNKLFASVEYRQMTDDEKVKAIQDVYSGALQKAKYEYFDNKGLPVTLALDKNYQEKYKAVKAYVSDKQFYAVLESVSGKSRDIDKAYTIQTVYPGAPQKLYDTLGISANSVEKAKALKDSGITTDQYISAIEQANVNGNDYISKDEAVSYLDSQDYSDFKKYALLKAMVPNLKDKNNPYY